MTRNPNQPGTWKEVEQLVAEQKFEEASKAVEKIRLAAQKSGNQSEWARALIREVQLRIGLHGYETAVRFLKEQPWPDSTLQRAALNLYYAHSLAAYYHAYSWEVNKREKMEAKGPVDLTAWTKDQIFAEAQKAYELVWNQRSALGKEPIAQLAEYLDRNNYPEGIRGTLRDAISYLYVELLADTSLWKPEESNELYRLNLNELLTGGVGQKLLSLQDPAIHPLLKIGYILGDLEAWHTESRRQEAALEARLERLRRLHDSFTESSDRAAILSDLEKRLPAFQDVAWWATGKALQAEFVRQHNLPDSLIRAHAVAEEGWKGYPSSIGGKRCFHILKSIEAPNFRMVSMAADGLQKRSVEISHQNIPVLYFRAYVFNFERRLESVTNYNLIPDQGEQMNAIRTQKPVAEWQVILPATPDYRTHRTFITPPLKTPGFYLIAASAQKDFADSAGNTVISACLVISDIVLLSLRESQGVIEVRTLSGQTGKPLSAVEVVLYKYDWQTRNQKVAVINSDENGVARFAYQEGYSNGSFFFVARKGQHVALKSDYVSFYRREEAKAVTASLLYTDRSIYRPLQKVFWKVLAYEGRAEDARFRTVSSSAVTVTLHDPNGEKVDSRSVTTNAFGSAAGEFVIPAGRLLGNWTLISSLNGQTSIRIEEYKRPTFEATFKAPEAPLRLNRPANLTGEVKYYFGLPVTSGAVKWTVAREPSYPWWWDWYEGGTARSVRSQIVAAGATMLKEDGTFTISFTPQADERRAAETKDVTYFYKVSADVTDEGGETRSAVKSFRLGFVAVEARLESETGFFREGFATAFDAYRTDLGGTPRPGKASWRLVSLKQPEVAVPPADLPILRPAIAAKSESAYQTPGDLLRPRWNPTYSYAAVLRGWPDDVEKGRGAIVHDAQGKAKLTLSSLPGGAYRLYYETVDDFGATYQTAQEFIVAGQITSLALPALLLAEKTSLPVSGKARFLALSGLADQPYFFEIWRNGHLAERRNLLSGKDATLIEIPVGEEDRGGFGVRLAALRDYQFMNLQSTILVPWDNKELKVDFATFRDKMRPGNQETWRVTVKSPSGANVEAGAAEILAYMYDRSLDIFAPHNPPDLLGLYPRRAAMSAWDVNLGQAHSATLVMKLFSPPDYPALAPDRLKFYEEYGIGGPGVRYGRRMGGVMRMAESAVAVRAAMPAAAVAPAPANMAMLAEGKGTAGEKQAEAAIPAKEAPVPLRTEFAETAFWRPQLLTNRDGSAAIEFTVPDSVTSWNAWIHVATRELQAASLHKEARSIKDLMVRPYLPRFLREGDRAELKVVINNATDRSLSGKLALEILDPETNQSILESFGIKAGEAVRHFNVLAGSGTNAVFSLVAPVKVGQAAFKVTAVSGDISDGELRPLPILPGRMHLAQSRFAALKNKAQRVMTFEDLKAGGDPTLITEQLVVTLDAQLFYSVLAALPYLVNYPYECTEQILNRFLSTGILSSLYQNYPAISKAAMQLAKRDTPLETWDAVDPNRKLALEETPWLIEARGGKDEGWGLTNVLDSRIAKAERESSLAKLRKAQTAAGGFPWWPGGPPSPYITLYILYGFAKAAEFGVEVPRDMVERGWAYLAQNYKNEYVGKKTKEDCCWEFLTFLNYVASCYPDPSWMGNALSPQERKDILNLSFKHWKEHSPYLKCQLALTLRRMDRPQDASLVFASVMDSAKSTQDEGTFWAPESRSWLWYNDTIETHAAALRTLMEITPSDKRKSGLVQWILLNKKLNHWKSTRATAEVIYSLVHYLKQEGELGAREDATVRVGNQTVQYIFNPDEYTGKKNQIVVPGEKVNSSYATIAVEKESKGLIFASATWHFSTDKLPEEDRGDFLSVSRSYFKREKTGKQFVLKPLAEGAALQPGDQVEVQLTIRSKHPCEYLHLRDPRAAGMEPENAVSRYKWDLGISWYEETRDSGANFFFESLPQGEYNFRYRLRANMAGAFKVSPATLQSMYAPEFSAYSAGMVLTVKP